jgi:hypothetical protein
VDLGDGVQRHDEQLLPRVHAPSLVAPMVERNYELDSDL